MPETTSPSLPLRFYTTHQRRTIWVRMDSTIRFANRLVLLVASALGIAGAIITESALSFLGLGFPSDFPTWGRLIFESRDYINVYPTRIIWPGVAISLTVLSVNFIGDGLRDALDPRLRGK